MITQATMYTKEFSVAPMMDWTDRHDRYFLRLIAPDILLYTEMITAQAIRHGDREHLLGYDATEHPVALQLGGSDPAMLAESARIGEDYGYDEINLNVGCPSPRVSSGRFGACLMFEPALVAECIAAMRRVVSVPVTVKCRIGVDAHDSYEALTQFIQQVRDAGCEKFIIHARKAWLSGLSPKENREIPPLNYETVRQIKRDFPALKIILNGGITSLDIIKSEIEHVDGAMIGRSAYHDPWLLHDLYTQLYGQSDLLNRQEVVHKMVEYARVQLEGDVKLHNITRHMLGLFQGQRGAAIWRRYISQQTPKRPKDVAILTEALDLMAELNAQQVA